MKKIKTVGLHVLVGICCVQISSSEKLDDQSHPMIREVMAYVKPFLSLPYDRESDYKSKDIQLPNFANVNGVRDFVVVSKIDSKVDSHIVTTNGQKWLTFDLCSPDLSYFTVSVSKPKTCQAACDIILLHTSYQDYSDGSGYHKFNKPNMEAGSYSLITNADRFARVFRLSIERGILIDVVFSPRQQPLSSPVNKDVIIAQMNELIDGLIALVDGDNKILAEHDEHYVRLKSASTGAKNRAAAWYTSENAASFNLFFADVPTQELADNGPPHEIKKLEKVIARKPYLIARADGKAIPLVKIADPKKVTTKVIELESEEREANQVYDIQFQSTVHGKPSYFEASLRSDSQYQISLYGSGKQSLKVFYLNKRGEVIEFGEVEVEVVEELLKGAAGDPGSAD